MMGALVQLLPHHHRLRPATWDSAPSSSCPWLPDRCPISTHHQPLLALRPAELLASRPGPPPSRWQRLLRPSFLHRRSPHGEVGYHYAAVWTLAAAGLAPAGTVLLWAATSLQGHYSPSSLPRAPPPPSRLPPLPSCRGYRAYLAPPLSRRGEEGFSSCSTRPGHRAAANHPARVVAASVSHSATRHAAFALRKRARPLELSPYEATSRSPSFRPDDSLPIL